MLKLVDAIVPCLGKYSLEETCKDNGERLSDFAISIHLAISSSTFPHKSIHLQI